MSEYAARAVDPDTAMRHAAVWACVRLVAGTVSSMPVKVIRAAGDASSPVSTPPLLVAPSAEVPFTGWLYQIVVSLLLRGNAYGRIVGMGANGWPTQIEILHPDSVTVRVVDGQWTWTVDRKPALRWPVGDLWHVPAFLVPGAPVGLSPIEYVAQAIGAGLAAEEFGSKFFEAGAPTALITSEQELNEAQARDVKSAYKRALSGMREPMVMGSGLKYQQVQISPTDSQFLDAQRFSGEQVCRVMGVPAEMIGLASSGQSVTYANREQRVADFLTFSLGPWLARLEEALSSLLPRPQRVKFNTGGLLRSDLAGRYASYKTAAEIQNLTGSPLLTTDEMRAFEDLPPIA